jgi:hypothetical protein
LIRPPARVLRSRRRSFRHIRGPVAHLTGRARSAGIRRFTALIATGNVAMTALLDNVGGTLVGRGPGTVEYEITLAPRQEPSLVWWFRSLDDIVFAWR